MEDKELKKILITGSFSTGKTSTIHSLRKELRNNGYRTVVVPEVARKCPLPLNRQQDYNSCLWLLHQQSADEIACQRHDTEFVICDRGVPDIYSHYLETKDRLGKLPNPIDLLNTYLVAWCLGYDITFFSSIDESIKAKKDAIRLADDDFRHEMQQRLRDALRILNVHYLELPFGYENRVKFILNCTRQETAP